MYVNSLGGESPVAVRRHAEWGKEKANDAIELGHQGSILLGILWETEECASGMLTDGCYDGAFVQNISIPFGWWCLQAAVTPSPFQASQAPRLISNLGFRDSTRGKCTACAYSRTLSVCPELFGTIAGIRSGMIACENGTKPALWYQVTYKSYHNMALNQFTGWGLVRLFTDLKFLNSKICYYS